MSPTHFKVKSLSGKIFTSVLAFTLAVIVALSVMMTTIYYLSYEHDAETELAASAQDAARYLNATPSSENAPALKEQFSGLTRYTLIDADGTVLFDSAADTDAMDNHADRPEVQEAADMGEAVTMRYSETLGTDTVYAAVKLDDGSIVRLSETRHSLLSFLSEMLMPVLIALIVAVALVFLLSKILTSRIMKPIDALDFANPLDNEIYEEMDPLLIRIDEQQRQLKQQNSELAEAENMRRDFSSNVSHEMKTPLQVISGYAELMKNDMVQPSDRQKFAALIYDEAQTMRSLINDVLTLSKLDESAFENDGATAINLYAVAQRVAGRLSSFADDQGVRVRVEGASACIAGSETLAEEMLYNLIENGIRYNHEGGLRMHGRRARERRVPDGRARQRHGTGHPGRVARQGVRTLLPRGQEPFEGNRRNGTGSGHRQACGYVPRRRYRGGEHRRAGHHVRAAFSQRLTSRLLSSMHGFLRPLRRALPFFWSLRSGAHVTENIAILGRNTSNREAQTPACPLS